MTTKDEALRIALEALEKIIGYTENWPASFTAHDCWKRDKVSALQAITAIKQAQDVPETNFGNMPQAQQAQEPVEARVPLTNERITELYNEACADWKNRYDRPVAFAHLIEAAHKIHAAITPETGNAAPPEASAITSGNGQAQEPVERELVRRLYVELFHVNQQFTSVLDEDGEPIAYTGREVRDVLSDAKAFLEANPPAPKQAEPEGYKLVPPEATSNMYSAGAQALTEHAKLLKAMGRSTDMIHASDEALSRKRYKAMWAAAPKQAEP